MDDEEIGNEWKTTTKPTFHSEAGVTIAWEEEDGGALTRGDTMREKEWTTEL